MSNHGLLRSVTIVDEFQVLKSSKSVLLFYASILPGTSFSLAISSSYFNLFSSFGGFTFSNLDLGGDFFLFGVANGYY